tara:strand:+ start:130 stop:324 length:195 start_codon:yes stop_codon:yes gene_type:complete
MILIIYKGILIHLLVALANAGRPDAGSPDAGSPDAGSPDAGSISIDALPVSYTIELRPYISAFL